MFKATIRVLTLTIRVLTVLLILLVIAGLTLKGIFHGRVFIDVIWITFGTYAFACVAGFAMYSGQAIRLLRDRSRKSRHESN